jgi:hypothetical protein
MSLGRAWKSLHEFLRDYKIIKQHWKKWRQSRLRSRNAYPTRAEQALFTEIKIHWLMMISNSQCHEQLLYRNPFEHFNLFHCERLRSSEKQRIIQPSIVCLAFAKVSNMTRPDVTMISDRDIIITQAATQLVAILIAHDAHLRSMGILSLGNCIDSSEEKCGSSHSHRTFLCVSQRMATVNERL